MGDGLWRQGLQHEEAALGDGAKQRARVRETWLDAVTGEQGFNPVIQMQDFGFENVNVILERTLLVPEDTYAVFPDYNAESCEGQ